LSNEYFLIAVITLVYALLGPTGYCPVVVKVLAAGCSSWSTRSASQMTHTCILVVGTAAQWPEIQAPVRGPKGARPL